ncbi:recombinase family protein [Bacillus cereus group sp. TH153LC]|uniref:recombinase family protein n=1 Tax=Bacillus cereus group sp. TH153LC TaxID=3018059 RepID=UPI0022DEDF4D|nr:recombinase family protein [Bacillus cereus group sp. TH153LC]MDA1658810.1 recombinase family protein [Bacillus cereus group sp. TH153LC]
MSIKLESIKDVAIYLRKSRTKEGLNVEESLEAHRTALIRLAGKYGWSYDLFEEVASSMHMDVREELQKMLDNVQDNKYDAVVVMDEDRLSRDKYDSAIIKKILLETDTYIVTADEECIDLSDDSDSLMTDFKAILANYEYKQISKRLVRGRDESARKGNWASGMVPIGYRYNRTTKKLEIDESEAEIVREAFRIYRSSQSIRETALQLNQSGYKTRRGKVFRNKRTSDILKNPIYKGVVIQRHYKMVGAKKDKPVLRDESEWVVHKNIYPIIIPPNEWNEVAEILKEKGRKHPKARAQTHGLTGLVKCAYCGQTHGIQWQTRVKKPYRFIKHCWRTEAFKETCRNRGTRYDKTLQAIISKIEERRDFISEEIKKISSDVFEFEKKKKAEKERLTDQLARIEKQLDKINHMYINEMLTDEELSREKPPRVSERDRILEKLKNLEEETQETNVSELQVTLERLDEILINYDKMSDKSLNTLLSSVINRVVLYNYKDKDPEPRLVIEFK